MEAGHADVWRYGYSYFLIAVNEHQRIALEQTKELAFAVRLGNHADEKDWKKFMKRK